jgi:hypothetical protein
MKLIAAILLIGTLLRHSAHAWLASDRYSASAWFYINGGVFEIALCGVLATLFASANQTVWTRLAIAACVIGIFEGLQISACRLAIKNIAAKPSNTNTCDFVTGLPIGAVMFSLYFLIICWAIGRTIHARRADKLC